jgi:hypothetical protein
MRALAREFKASVDLENGGTQLRLLSQPLFRYESETDGAMFAFVLTTDPEVLLIIEDRVGAGGDAWHYAFARMSNHSLVARHRDRVVWGAPADMDEHNPSKPYCSRSIVGPQMSATR